MREGQEKHGFANLSFHSPAFCSLALAALSTDVLSLANALREDKYSGPSTLYISASVGEAMASGAPDDIAKWTAFLRSNGIAEVVVVEPICRWGISLLLGPARNSDD